ncbi:MAG TPA: hypothetical protein VG929_00155 [Actinomycetota bacterium]|nr:hypothetical protein [Actinomycetota bacterium]
MALHDRLRPATAEPAVARPGHAVLIALVLSVLAAGFAYSMPHALQVSAEEGTVTEEMPLAATTPTPEETTVVEVVPTPAVTEQDDAGGHAEDDGEKGGNHGSAVSAAAHCDLTGRAHGELVRSVAQDKDAAVATAEAACEAAKAAAASASTGAQRRAPGGKALETAKPARAARPAPKAPAATGSRPSTNPVPPAQDSDATATDDASDDPSEAAPAEAPPGHGNKNKP